LIQAQGRQPLAPKTRKRLYRIRVEKANLQNRRPEFAIIPLEGQEGRRYQTAMDDSRAHIRPFRTIRCMARQLLDVDPRTLHVPPSRMSGADPFKLHRQIAPFGSSTAGMPAPWVYRGSDGELQLYNGVTRATRIAKLSAGTLIRVEVIGNLAAPVGHLPTIGDLLP
jgi:hypothetical protein